MLFGKPSLFTRIAVGKAVGFAFGLLGLFVIPLFWPEAPWSLRIGVLFWYTTVGAFIGVMGVVNWHPVLHMPMPWWFRSLLIGAWMNFLLVLIAHSEITAAAEAFFGLGSSWSSPYWLLVEGGVIGLVIGYLCTKLGGEGKATLDEMSL